MQIQRYNSNGRFHEAVEHNGVLYLSGQVAPSGGSVKEQAEECLNNIEKTLKKYNSDKDHILSAVVYLTDMAYFAEFNEVWDSWFTQGCQPTRTCVGAPLAASKYFVEITVTAAVID